ncbi:hypothetical protein V5O48_000767 [Marasmius crinis-equi]|uniref:Uncharacterized protein n=1 Tax=Marasmius crinis-equi TaxID=585013 RepID=A0ABR3G0F3_9AGAR
MALPVTFEEYPSSSRSLERDTPVVNHNAIAIRDQSAPPDPDPDIANLQNAQIASDSSSKGEKDASQSSNEGEANQIGQVQPVYSGNQEVQGAGDVRPDPTPTESGTIITSAPSTARTNIAESTGRVGITTSLPSSEVADPSTNSKNDLVVDGVINASLSFHVELRSPFAYPTALNAPIAIGQSMNNSSSSACEHSSGMNRNVGWVAISCTFIAVMLFLKWLFKPPAIEISFGRWFHRVRGQDLPSAAEMPYFPSPAPEPPPEPVKLPIARSQKPEVLVVDYVGQPRPKRPARAEI